MTLLWNLIVNGLLASSWFPQRFKAPVMRLGGATIGNGVGIRRRVDFFGPALVLGRDVFINVGTQIQNHSLVTIGDDVRIGPRVTIATVSHEIGPSVCRAKGLTSEPVTIEAGCWLAAGATILPGVTVRQGCIIAAGAVVVEDCAPNGMYAGVPARRVKELPVD